MNPNIMLMTDSYKASHWKQYPPNTQSVYSYFESRGGEFDNVCFFGLQYYLKKYLEGQVITQAKIDEAEEMWAAHFGTPGVFNREGWEYILKTYEGKLPVEIKAVPEGTVVPVSNILMSIRNTDKKCYWLTNWLETILVQVWYGSTVATQSRTMKQMLLDYLEATGDPSLIAFKLHNFGYRGVSSVETAGVGGAAHLVNFMGTDTFEGVRYAKEYYGEPMAGFSIPASEHSTITSWGKEHEVDAMANMLQQYPTGLVACVSDSFDIYNACENLWGGALKDKIMQREGCLVVRPDSGYPPEVVSSVLKILWDKFGGTTNSKGYKVLDSHVRVIQGDGIDRDMLQSILQEMKWKGWSADNIAFGSGGGLLQKLNRDTLKFAFKCSSITVNGKEQDVYKEPVTDKGKNSKRGRLKLVQTLEGLTTVSQDDDNTDDELQTVFYNGALLNEQTFSEIRERASYLEPVKV